MYTFKCHHCEDDDCFDEAIALNPEHYCISLVGKVNQFVDEFLYELFNFFIFNLTKILVFYICRFL